MSVEKTAFGETGRYTLHHGGIMKKIMACFLFVVSIPVFSGNISDIQVIEGKCAGQSHIAEGPVGGDLTKGQSRFFCDTAILAFFDDSGRHVMVSFVEKDGHDDWSVGFAGMMDDDGQIMSVHHVYLGQDVHTVREGYCRFFFEKHEMKSVACGAPVDRGTRRTVPVVVFEASENP